MLPRSQRLSVAYFNQVMEKGRVTHSPLFLLRFLKTDSAGQTRIAAVAPQKIFKKAVQRNKLRRQMYEAVRPLYADVRPQLHVVIFAKAIAATADQATLKKEIKDIFVKAGLLK